VVDRVYGSDLPQLRKTLAELKSEFSRLDTPTDWVRLRIVPLQNHVNALERALRTWRSTPLRGAVPMLHSDLVYLKENVRHLQRQLERAKQRIRLGHSTR
jgi:hypothetical protein